MSRLLSAKRLAIPFIAAVLAVGVTAPVVAEYASAQPVRPDWDRDRDRDRDRGDARLREENEQLRKELGLYQQAYAELNDGLDRIERANRRNRDRRSMTMIDRAMRDARRRAAQYVQPWSYEQAPPVVVHPAPATRAMSDRDFAALAAQIDRASFADDKVGLVKTAAQTNYFTVAQVVAMMELASFDDTKVEIAVACAPHVVDGDKWFQVYGALTFSSSRDSLRQQVGNR